MGRRGEAREPIKRRPKRAAGRKRTETRCPGARQHGRNMEPESTDRHKPEPGNKNGTDVSKSH